MTATTLKISSLPGRTAPRGAIWAARIFAAVLTSASKLIDSVADQRRRAAEMNAAREVMLMARDYDDSQPGFAADLRAAAMRMNQD